MHISVWRHRHWLILIIVALAVTWVSILTNYKVQCWNTNHWHCMHSKINRERGGGGWQRETGRTRGKKNFKKKKMQQGKGSYFNPFKFWQFESWSWTLMKTHRSVWLPLLRTACAHWEWDCVPCSLFNFIAKKGWPNGWWHKNTRITLTSALTVVILVQ